MKKMKKKQKRVKKETKKKEIKKGSEKRKRKGSSASSAFRFAKWGEPCHVDVQRPKTPDNRSR